MKKSTKYILIFTGGLLGLILLYELSFRFCTGRWGEINTDTSPVSLYYVYDLYVPSKSMETFFRPRAKLRLGKVRLAEGTGAYISGGTFYRKLPDGSWENITEGFARMRRNKTIEPANAGDSK